MNTKYLLVISSCIFVASVAVLFVGAYGGVLKPDHPFEFYALTFITGTFSGCLLGAFIEAGFE